MNKSFEDEFLEVQTQIISLCIEFAENRADKIYAYGSIEEHSLSFNAFFNIDGKIKTTNQIVTDTDAIWDFLDLGQSDLEKLKQICAHHEKSVPTELKMIYDCKSGTMDAKYKYESICSAKTGIDASEIFMEWLDLEKIKQHCEKVNQILRLDDPAAKSAKKIMNVMEQIRSCDTVDELPDVDWTSMVRCFVDETTDYQNPALFEIDTIRNLSAGLKGKL